MRSGVSPRAVAAVAAVVAAVAIVYRHAPSGYFFEDDFQWLAGTLMFDPASVFQLVGRTHFFRPVIELYFWITLPLFGGSPALFHAANVVVHACNGLWLFLIARRLARSDLYAFTAAVVFVVMPGYVEAVAWVGALAEPVGAFFGLLSVWSLLVFEQERRPAWRVVSIAAFLLSLLTHESSVVFLAILALVPWAADSARPLVPATRRAWVEALRLYAPYVAIAALYLAIDLSINRNNYLVEEGHYRPGLHVVTNLFAYIVSLYVGKRNLASFVLIAVAIALILAAGTRRAKLGVGWMVVALLPFLSFTSGIASRYQYLPAAGFALLVAEGVLWLDRALAGRPGRVPRQVLIAIAVAAIATRFAVFASKAVTNFVERTLHYERFAQSLREKYPRLETGATVVVEQPDTPAVQHQYLEGLVRWEFRDPTIQVVTRGD